MTVTAAAIPIITPVLRPDWELEEVLLGGSGWMVITVELGVTGLASDGGVGDGASDIVAVAIDVYRGKKRRGLSDYGYF